MGLSKKKRNTNLITLRIELNRLNTNDEPPIVKQETTTSVTPIIDRASTIENRKSAEGGGIKSAIREAKKRGRKANQLIDGSKLLTC